MKILYFSLQNKVEFVYFVETTKSCNGVEEEPHHDSYLDPKGGLQERILQAELGPPNPPRGA